MAFQSSLFRCSLSLLKQSASRHITPRLFAKTCSVPLMKFSTTVKTDDAFENVVEEENLKNNNEEEQIEEESNIPEITLEKLEEVQSLLKDAEGKIEDLEEKYKVSLAEMENTRRRARLDVDNARKFGIQKFAASMLDVVDNLERAIDSVPQADLESIPLLNNFHIGVEMTKSLFLKSLNSHGVSQFNPLGQPFDYHLHQALFEIEDDTKEPGTVAVVTRTGYLLNDRVLRPAQVGTVRKPPTTPSAAEEEN